MKIFTVKPGFEYCAIEECRRLGFLELSSTDGLVRASFADTLQKNDLCFSSWQLFDCEQPIGDNSSGRVRAAVQWYCDAIRSERITEQWPLVWQCYTENGFLPDISKASLILDLLKKKLSRISRLALTEYPLSGHLHKGFFVVETPASLYCSRRAIFYGQKRMKNDPEAPSRSYLKIEEAFSVLLCAPVQGETVVDLGAAPGGWSFAAAKRGATVIAIDNGPLKKGAATNRNIQHLREDAFKWFPQRPIDWLFCDMVEEPSTVLSLVKLWLNRRLCRFVIVNLKCGHTAPHDILRLVKEQAGISSLAGTCICRQLFHDRNEFTVMMKV